MKKLIALIVAIGALYYFKPGLFPAFGHKGAFDAKGNPQVLVFTDSNCADWCAKAMQDLRERGVSFQELHLAESEAIRDRYQKLGGTGTIPYVVVGSQVVPGYHKGKMASALGRAYGDKYLTRAEHIFYASHFKPDGSPTVYMYGASWCGYCRIMREELEKRHIPYAEVDVEKSSDRALIEDAMAIDGFPVTYVGYERIDGEKVDAVLAALKTAGNRRM